jgi:hypothetical protein
MVMAIMRAPRMTGPAGWKRGGGTLALRTGPPVVAVVVVGRSPRVTMQKLYVRLRVRFVRTCDLPKGRTGERRIGVLLIGRCTSTTGCGGRPTSGHSNYPLQFTQREREGIARRRASHIVDDFRHRCISVAHPLMDPSVFHPRD